MEDNKEIKKVFELFTNQKFEEAQELNSKILESFPNHMYAKRYEKILSDKIAFDNKANGKIGKSAKVKGKSLKCPHCLAKIPFSGLTGEQRNKIKKGYYNNLEIKCPYCHTKFILQKKKAHSRLGIKIGNTANIDGKKYRATGYVEYKGYWYEDGYSDVTNYLEWILLGEDNSYYYFSEGYSIDDGSSEDEFELSQKIIPNFRVPTSFNSRTEAKVNSIYGENSKNYVVGEETILYDFKISGKNYIKEVEGSGSQKEAGVYKTVSIPKMKALKIFGKELNNYTDTSNDYKQTYRTNSNINFGNNMEGILKIIGFTGIVSFSLISEGILSWTFFGYLIGFAFILFIGKTLFEMSDSKMFGEKLGIMPKIFFGILGGLIFVNFIFTPIFNTVLEDKQKIELSKLGETAKAQINFTNGSLKNQRQTSSTRYDYGGIKTYYEANEGLKFSIQTEEDKKIIEKIKNGEAGGVVEKMFNGVIYKLK